MVNSNWFRGIIFALILTIIPFVIFIQNEKPREVKKITFEEEFKIVHQELLKEKANQKLLKIKQEKINKNKIDKLSEFIYKNNYRVDKEISRKFARYIFKNTENTSLVIAIVTRESNFNPMAKSRVGALGMGQIRPEVWLPYLSKKIPEIKKKKDLYNWRLNILATDCILNKLSKRYDNNLYKILRHYVGGNHKTYIKDVKKLNKVLEKCI